MGREEGRGCSHWEREKSGTAFLLLIAADYKLYFRI